MRREQAEKDNLAGAISILTGITSDQQPNYDKAKSLAQGWYDKLLSKQRDYGMCDAGEATGELRDFLSSTVTPPPKDNISEWERRDVEYQGHLQQIELALQQNNFDVAMEEANKIPDYCKWRQKGRIAVAHVKQLLAVHKFNEAKEIADKTEIGNSTQQDDFNQQAQGLLAAYVPPTPILPEKSCYQINVQTSDIRANNVIGDGVVDDVLSKIQFGTSVLVTNPPDTVTASSAENPKLIKWLKVAVPSGNIEGWVAEQELKPVDCLAGISGK